MNIEYKSGGNQELRIDTKKLCEICRKQNGTYTCPRCNIAYCSLNCYRDQIKHLSCSEDFYQDQIITELKMCKLEENSDKTKMVEILKRVAKDDETENILPGDDDSDTLSENECDNTEKIDENVDDAKLIKAYEVEATKWVPWWHEYKEQVKELSKKYKEFKFNESLIRKSMKINVENANPLIFNEILTLFYVYSMFAYIYQINEEDNNVDENNNLDEELILNFLRIDKIIKNGVPKNPQSLSERISLIIKILINEEDTFLKEYLNVRFLTGLINEMIIINKSISILSKIISNIYNFFSSYLKSRKTHLSNDLNQKNLESKKAEAPNPRKQSEVADEKPLNVFHFNKGNSQKIKFNDSLKKRTRVQIIQPKKDESLKEIHAVNNQRVDLNIDDIAREIKIMMKRLEFYFKWINLNQTILKKSERKNKTTDELKAAQETLNLELEEFHEEKEFINKNLDTIRKKSVNSNKKTILIEEI